ncbi:MAG: response regulator [Saprospiraceae bacterium]
MGNVTLDIAKNLATAYHKTGQQLYDCILSDIKLPDGNGFELIAKLRGDSSAINQQTPIIVLTASANEKEANYAKKMNIKSYIGKPFPPQLIISEMKKIFKEEPTEVRLTTMSLEQQPEHVPITEPYFAHLEKSFKNRSRLQIEMFDIFLDQLPLAITQMEKGLKENDLKIFHYDAHRIKSTINIIGLPKLKPLITKMDEYCYKKIHLEQLPELYEQFKIQAAKDIKIILARKEELLVAS